jgi:hypothetical protein
MKSCEIARRVFVVTYSIDTPPKRSMLRGPTPGTRTPERP